MIISCLTNSSWKIQINVQGYFRIATANLLHQSLGHLQQIESCRWQRISCRGALFTVAPCRMNSKWTIPDESKNNSSIILPFTCPVKVFSFEAIMAMSRWLIDASVVNHSENTMFCLLLWSSWEMSHNHQHYWSGCHKWSCDCHIGFASLCCVICDTFGSCDMYHGQFLQLLQCHLMIGTCLHVPTSLISSLVQTVVGQPVYISSSKPSLPCIKRLCHLNASLQPTLHWKVSLAELPNYWQNFMFVHCSNCDILKFRCLYSEQNL